MGLGETFALMVPGQPVFDDLRRCSGAEWKRGPVEWFTGPGWNGAQWNRLELAKSGHLPSRCVGGTPSGDSSALPFFHCACNFAFGLVAPFACHPWTFKELLAAQY